MDNENKTNQSPFEDSMKVDKKSIPLHTMQEDLDILKKHSSDSMRVSLPSTQNEMKREEVAENKRSENSPFLKYAPVKPDNFPISPERIAPHQKTEKNISPLPEKIKIEDLQVAKKMEGENKEEKKTTSPVVAKKLKWDKVLTATLFIIIILIIFGGGYYFWITRESDDLANQPVVEEEQNQPVIDVPSDKFSVVNPNYLNIEVESITVDGIKQLLSEKISEMEESKIKGPVEFLITDKNNNPIAFSVFANLFELKLSADLLSNLEESFSIYLYDDEGNTRAGLAVELKDREKVSAEITKEETTLVNDMVNLFFGTDINNDKKSFSDGSFQNYSIRYINLNTENTISLDYALTDRQLVIGTSKNSSRAILTKLESANNIALPEGENGAGVSDGNQE